MALSPAFISRVNVINGPDTTMICFGAPSGAVEGGGIKVEEAFRIVMSYRLLREVAALMAQKVAEYDAHVAVQEARRSAEAVKAAVERRTILDLDDRITPITRLQ
ncbi:MULTISPECIES: hypothetical protein [unclassified Caulobacter]|uniref:hypothetical protein n=1 Tax=unclassified Caulobacter TaxID=2648921 RepID=UPI000D3AC7F8|nr:MULTISPECIES: hypothetical protein [unclassified Caulobacter]PTS81739.1 hypothetical protein DBR21_18635 [Caulobacter sp. HMWF009]PTT05418.1 hypothetical protein DBR10_15665 [Caulobacter sp. HMWF025]PTT76525.1 hypothetical protein DBR41_25140 [Pseudomonas sp. HMWF010]